MNTSQDNIYEWKKDLSRAEWDNLLQQLDGHPLQSAAWGDSKNLSSHTKDHRWAIYQNGSPIFLVRFEERILLNFLKIAWIPRGPVINKGDNFSSLKKYFSNN